jgi:transketolase
VTLHEALRAAEILRGEGIAARVIDCYSVKPVDTETLAAGQQNLHLTHLAVREIPGSGSGEELLAWAGIDADHIAAAARKLVGASADSARRR